MKRWFISAACFCMLIATTLLSSRSAFADSGSYGDIAYSMAQSTPYFAFADSKVAAEANALAACYNSGATDCNSAGWVKNGYDAIAIDFSWSDPSNRPWGTGWGDTQAEAEKYAKQECEAHNGNAQTCLVSSQSTTNAGTNSANGGFGWGALSAKVGKAIAWAFNVPQSQQGQYYGNCEVFVENAYGTQYKFLTAQLAFEQVHTSTDWSPNIGSLVFFVPNSGNQKAGHVGIYVGDGEFVSATESSPVVAVNSLTDWGNKYATYEGWGDAPSHWPGQ